MQSGSIYERYGGFAKINRVVMDFYDALLDSDELGPYFDNVDMARLIDHQTKFVSGLLGGPVDFDDEVLRRAHRHLRVTQEHFDELKRVLGNILETHAFLPADVQTVLAAVEARRPLVVA
ncbi:MAG: group 1 truncated hemoglobin [Pseudomonadota bacterium]